MSSGVSYLMSCLSVHRTGKKLLLPDPMVFKAIISLQEHFARIRRFSLRCLESAGTFGQDMKREYEGERIPSQSLAQQDEPVQQMNLPEAGKEIPTRTLCKKTETYPMKMLLKGTTSTNPSKSAPPTSATSANEDRTRADNQVAADDTPISTFDKDGVGGTVSPSLANARSKTSDVIEPPDCPVKFDNLEDFFALVNGQNKQAQSLGFSAVQSYDKISATQKSTPSAEMLATVKCDVKRLLTMSLQELLLPENSSALSAALSVYAAAPDLSAERVLAMEKLKENLAPFSLILQRAKKDQAEYYKKAAKKVSLSDGLIKDQELCTKLKDCNDKLKDCNDKLEYQISWLKASLKDAKTKRKAIQEQSLNLARRCSEKSSALDEMEAEVQVLKVMKELADLDTALLEECLKDFKSKIID